MQVNQKVSSRRVDFKADQPFQHHQLELELESSLARGEIGQASWLTLPLTVLILAILLQWDKKVRVNRIQYEVELTLFCNYNEFFFYSREKITSTSVVIGCGYIF